MNHTPVLLQEVITQLNPQPGEIAIDATLGLGGHARAILDKLGAGGQLVGIERSQAGLELARENLKKYQNQLILVNDDFRNLKKISEDHQLSKINIAFFDLGLASWQLDTGYMGLSFQVDQPLDMRMTNPTDDLGQNPSLWTADKQLAHLVRTYRFRPAAEIVNSANQKELELILREIGGVRTSRQVADRIVKARTEGNITSTSQLVKAVKSTSPKLLAPIFQALRIVVNDEYTAVAVSLPVAWNMLSAGGRLAVISFQGNEHRLVKQVLKGLEINKIKRILPSEDEVEVNPRSRSAQLRIAVR
ncbi:16S rRNA (cytosine(1402)-N(4))-methyltransferase [Candidatus Berkelbacteria bacterium]|nr:16S rRNA (cytosine(1402)-N(4))-methyltransferase [Candidatus Berkelbacteria bacterium]